MILRNFKWILTLQLLYLLVSIEAQNARSYDTNDWIPITPSPEEKSVIVEQKRATGRVLNLDAPQQKFFPEEDYRKKRPEVEQYLRETHYPKNRHNIRQHKQRYERPYKFESSYKPKPQPQLQYFTNKEVKPHTVEQPPPLSQPQFIQQPPPYQAPQFIYQQQPQINNIPQLLPQQQFIQSFPQQVPVDQNYQQYQQYAPYNNSLYQTLNPSSINQELLSEIQNSKPIEPVTKVESTTKKTEEKDKETIQLLYVPLENLKSSQPISQDTQNVYSTADVPRHEKQIGSFSSYTPQQRLVAIEKDFIQQALEAQRLQEEIRNGRPILYHTTTYRPKKRKPHQPPLAVYMGGQQEAEVSDVLDVLKDAKSIAVQDNFRPDSPKVFIGPSSLTPPEGYSKFPLPYLNSIEGNRVERKIEQLPFFVAPLSYHTPDGYSKIPLPSPHVGSVVVSTKDDLHDKLPVPKPQNLNLNQYQYVEKPQTSQFSIQNTNEQVYNYKKPQIIDNQQSYAKLNDNLQYANPKTPEEIKENYKVPARPQLPDLPPTLQEPVRQVYTLNQDEIIKDQVVLKPNSGQNIYQQQEINLGSKSQSQKTNQYEFPAISTTPSQITVDNLGQFHLPVRSTLAPQDLRQYTIPSRDYSSPSPTPKVQVQSFNLSDKIKSSIEVVPAIEVTAKTFLQNNLRDQLNKEAVPSYEALSKRPPTNQQTYNINPLELAINQYELQQINSQLLEKAPKIEQTPPQSSSLYYDNSYDDKTQFVSSTPRYEDNFDTITTPRSEKTKRRGKPSRQPTRTTSRTYDNTKYTVLEDYNLRQRSTTPKTVETTDVNITPTIVYRQRTTTPSKYENTNIENIPSKVYKLAHQVQPVYSENRPPINQHILNGDVLDKHVLHSYLSSEDTRTKSQPTTVRYEEVPTTIPKVEPLSTDQGEGYYSQDQNTNSEQQSQVLSGYISNLQEQSVRALLVPNLLVPTTEQLKDLSSTPKYEPTTTTTEDIQTTAKSTEEPYVETTTQRRTRGRVRGNTSNRYTTTSTPRRTVNRRRPSHTRTTTERVSTTTDYGRVTDYTRRSVSNTKPRFRTRGRPTQNAITDRIVQSSTTENEIKAFRQPELQSGFQASPLHGEPNSYMQFEHSIDEQKIITIRPEEVSEESPSVIKGYHQVYSLPSQLENGGTYVNTPSGAKPVVDIKITHPLDTIKESEIITTPEKNSQYVRFTGNAHPGEVAKKNRNSEEVTTTRSNIRIRGRTRGKSRFPSTTTPRTTTTTTEKQSKQNEPEEFYGFFRNPDFNKPKLEEQQVQIEVQTEPPIQYYSSSYVSSPRPKTVYNEEFVANGYSTDKSEISSPVHFVGEIRPKYYSTAQYEESKISIATAEQDPTTTEPQFVSTGSRTQSTTSKTEENTHSKFNEVNDQTTKRSRTRNRGSAHYRVPEKLRSTTDEADIAGGNYPASFFTSKQTTTEEPPSFQITADPIIEDEEDQSPHSSIYSPKFVPKPGVEWIEASALPFFNDLPNDDKPIASESSTEQPIALPIVGSTEVVTEEAVTNIFNESSKEMSDILTQINDMVKTEEEFTTELPEETKLTKKNSRRRGVWKLVRQRPIDQFETAESQNYESVINNFDSIKKVDYRKHYFEPEKSQTSPQSVIDNLEEPIITTPVKEEEVNREPTTTVSPSTTSTEGSIFDTLYDMFGMKSDDDITTTTTAEPTTTTISPTFPQEITEEPAARTSTLAYNSTSDEKLEETIVATIPRELVEDDETDTNVGVTKSTFEVEPWEMKAVKTSTSTEISHETEICYKGRCVKSLDRKTRS